MKGIFLSTLFFCLLSCSSNDTNIIQMQTQKLRPLHGLKVQPVEGDWLYTHQEEFVSLDKYISQQKRAQVQHREKVYVIKLGSLNSASDSIFNLTKVYLGVLFQAEVHILKHIPSYNFPIDNKRDNGQVDANYILNGILKPILPNDAHTLLAITTYDLYPGNEWNYVFGLADLHQRVGVWSMARFGNADSDCFDFSLCAARTLHVASHEALHTLGLKHCSTYECLMNGANSLQELDRQVSWLCPDCLEKLCWRRNMSPHTHIEKMKRFYQQGFYKDSLSLYYYKTATELLP